MKTLKLARYPDELNSFEAARYMGVSVRTVRKWCDERIIRHISRFGRLYFRKVDLDQFIAENTEIRQAQ